MTYIEALHIVHYMESEHKDIGECERSDLYCEACEIIEAHEKEEK